LSGRQGDVSLVSFWGDRGTFQGCWGDRGTFHLSPFRWLLVSRRDARSSAAGETRGQTAYGSGLLGPPPWGRALCLPFGSASLRTNGPSPRLPFTAEPAMGTGPSSSLRLRFAPDKWSVPKAPVCCNSRSRSLCGGKEVKARVYPPETAIVKTFCQSWVRLHTTSRRPGFSGIQ